jgi:Cd2+/Zn2+-exporting ATPase
VTYVVGIAATAQNFVHIKGGAYLDSLTIFFDKTGTFTNGEFTLLDLVKPESTSCKKTLQYLSIIEEWASHPTADAILFRASNAGVSIPSNMTFQKHTLLAGEGVLGVIDGKEVYVGNEWLFERLGLLDGLPAKIQSAVALWKNLGGTIGFMSVEGRGIVCAYCAAEVCVLSQRVLLKI